MFLRFAAVHRTLRATWILNVLSNLNVFYWRLGIHPSDLQIGVRLYLLKIMFQAINMSEAHTFQVLVPWWQSVEYQTAIYVSNGNDSFSLSQLHKRKKECTPNFRLFPIASVDMSEFSKCDMYHALKNISIVMCLSLGS